VALGNRISGDLYEPVDLQVVETSLGMLGVALENSSLYNSLRENNRKLRSANEHLQELDNLKSEFLRNVNHELRTPLTIVIAYLDLVLHEEIDKERKDEVLQICLGQSEKLLGLLENLLDYSALSADSLTVNIEPCDVADMLQEFYQERLPGIVEGLREFTLSIGDAIPQVRVDPLRLRQILNVIIDNAVKFTPQGARIALRVATCDKDGDIWARIDVDDDGPGIPEDRIPGLFESFRQLDGSSRRNVGGMGMGLALARDLAERIGSHLSATSDMGKGSTFTLMVPTA
jgi:signal transduction histidine kinase